MIGSLRGTLIERDEQSELLVEVAGVGYRVLVSPATAASLGTTGSEVFIYTHHVVREDSETLYGFISVDERTVFETLISVHGVGPSLALAILSVHSPVELQSIVVRDDLPALCLVPGVGRKTAARLVIELKNKLDIVSSEVPPSPEPGSATSSHDDVRVALENLGYGIEEIHAVLSALPRDGDAATLLKDALRQLATGI